MRSAGQNRPRSADADESRGDSPGRSPTSSRRGIFTEEELNDLYQRLKGFPGANGLLDARATFRERDYTETIQHVRAVRDLYQSTHRKTLRKDPERPDGKTRATKQQALDLKRKQEKIRGILERFDQALEALQKMVEWKLSAPPPATEMVTAGVTKRQAQLPDGFRAAFESAEDSRSQFQAVRRYYVARKVTSEQDIEAHALYYLVTKKRAYLIRVSSTESAADAISICDALAGQSLRAIPVPKFLELGKKQSLVRLVAKNQGQAEGTVSSPGGDPTVASKTLGSGEDSTEKRAERILDFGAFSQLLDAAQRSGIVPNADVIAHVRDREFRKGNYQKAIQDIQSLYTKFTLQASQREQRLRREYIDIAGGKIQMSAKELQQKKARDIAETQRVDRANKKFVRVIEGLRILLRTDDQA